MSGCASQASRIRAGDCLLVVITSKVTTNELRTVVTVDGWIMLPYSGAARAANLPLQEVRQSIEKLYRPFLPAPIGVSVSKCP
jgi:protein involved in polysaccharide export with SLBB domain